MQLRTAINTDRTLHQSYWLLTATVCTAIFFMLIVNDAHADAGLNLEHALCGISVVIQTNVAKGIATLAIIMLGIGAMLGKVSWSMALLVAVGIAIVFNAFSVVQSLDPSIKDCIDTNNVKVK